LLSLIA
jgi:hypothetical protein